MLEIRASLPALTFLLAQGNRERDCPVIHKVIDREQLWRFRFDVTDRRMPTEEPR